MPGRTSTRNSAASRIARKSSSNSLASRRATASPALAIPDEGPSSTLRAQVCAVFSDAQRSPAGHRKLAIGLRKLQEACCYEFVDGSRKLQQPFGEDDFNVEVMRCVIRLMGVKKTEAVGDRVVRFLGLFLRHANTKDAALVPETDLDETQSVPETPTTRLILHILSVLLQLLASKEKTVRYRATQLLAHIVNSLDSIDDEYYHMVRIGLLRRIRDKEPMIRVQAVLGLGRLAGNEDEGDLDQSDSGNEAGSGLLEKLLEVLQNDPSAEVRRTLLLNLPLTPGTLPYLLERARDLDSGTRRVLYSRLLPALGDFRHLSLSMREKLLRWGLHDRDENVRKASGRLLCDRWIEDCAGAREDESGAQPIQTAAPSFDGLLELLERIDVINSAGGNGAALDAMKVFWAGRPDYLDAVSFDDPFWDHLTPENTFMARTFNDFCTQGEGGKFESLGEDKMPEVTKFTFFLQRYMNELINLIQRNNALGEGEQDDDTVEKEFIVEQLLHIAKALDYTDEIGRRKMFAILREVLAVAELPDETTRLVVDVLRDVCGAETAAEREFCRVVLEAVAEVHDAVAADEPIIDNDDQSFYSAQSEMGENPVAKTNVVGTGDRENSEMDEARAIREIMINMKCLHMAQCMLENVEGNLQQNVHLVSMLNNLVVPAVRSHEAPIRERGLLCLGLCCLLDKALAEENLTLFLHCFNKGHEALQVSALHILSDILGTHPGLISAENANVDVRKSVHKIFAKGIKAANTPDVQSAAIMALCKLMLTSVVHDDELLRQTVTCYFDPGTRENPAVTQSLSYFLPVFCYSKRENMALMAAVTADVIHAQVALAEEDEEEEGLIGPVAVGNMLVDWTDARKLVVHDQASLTWDEAGRKEAKAVNGDIHLVLAESTLERALAHGCTKVERKALLSMLGKLYITAVSSQEKLQTVSDLVAEAIDTKIAMDGPTRNALNKIQTSLKKAFGDAGINRQSIEATEDPTQALDQTTLNQEAEDEESKMDTNQDEEEKRLKDALLDELLDEEDEDL